MEIDATVGAKPWALISHHCLFWPIKMHVHCIGASCFPFGGSEMLRSWDWLILLQSIGLSLTTLTYSVASLDRRWELDLTLVAVATVVVQDVRFYRDLNSDRWIQSPEC